MKNLILITVEQEVLSAAGDTFIPGRLHVVAVSRASLLYRMQHWFRTLRNKPDSGDMKHLSDTGLSVGITITTDQYAQLLRMRKLPLTDHVGLASLDLIQTPKPTQTIGSPIEL